MTESRNAPVRTVGVNHSGYNERRNFSSLDIDGYVFKKQIDRFKFLDHLYFKLYNQTKTVYHNLHTGYGRCDLFHFFNGISLGKKPWITTFETFLPRLSDHNSRWNKRGIKALSGNACRQLLAMSQCAYDFQDLILQKHYPSHRDSIMEKTMVLHPGQELLINNIEEKELSEQLTLTIVGGDFFRKGGMEVLRTVDKMINEGADIKLNIISSMNYGDYATHTTQNDLTIARKLIEKHSSNITHHHYLENDMVLQIFKETHVALLPTYADTYGYSVLEAQAAGCPVITTNIRALPEINNEECGYLIEVPKDNFGNGVLSTSADRNEFSNVVEQGLYSTLSKILNNAESLQIKSQNCLRRIKTEHDLRQKAVILKEVYDKTIL